jgi:rubrerythrin
MSKTIPLNVHLSLPSEKRNLDWIRNVLQSAIELEHATLPLYLSTMFSLEVQNYTTYNLIRSVVMEEMVHMAIACNILSSLEGKPAIKKLSPQLPGKGLPGGVEPDLEVVLARLSIPQLKNFMRLESPAFLLPDEFKKEEYPSIGTLYKVLKEAIKQNAEEIRETVRKVLSAPADTYSNQVGDNIGFTTIQLKEKHPDNIDEVDQLINGINEIIEQGEGSGVDNLWAESFEDEESHYARFGEIYYGGRLQKPVRDIKLSKKTESEFFKGHKISWPVVTNLLAIPTDGYQSLLKSYGEIDPSSTDLKALTEALDDFDILYTGIMNDLDAMWNGLAAESWPNFGKAVGAMMEMRVKSCFYIMRYEIPKNIVESLKDIYPAEFELFTRYTDLSTPVFFGPRFINNNS